MGAGEIAPGTFLSPPHACSEAIVRLAPLLRAAASQSTWLLAKRLLQKPSLSAERSPVEGACQLVSLFLAFAVRTRAISIALANNCGSNSSALCFWNIDPLSMFQSSNTCFSSLHSG